MGQAHIWAWPKPNMGPAHGPGPWGRARAGARTYLGKNIFQKQYPEKHEYSIYHEFLTFVYFSKKTRAEK